MSAAGRVLARCDALAAFTEEPARITRPYGTRALADANAQARVWLEEAGLAVRVDAIGSLIGRTADGPAGTLVLGSHLDSVRDAGRYDGPLGVLVAIAAAEEVRARGIELPFALEVVAFADEEGLRYRTYSFLASRVYAGLFDETDLGLRDDDGLPLVDVVAAMGGDPGALTTGARSADGLLGYLEVHIEQGPVLQDENLPVGIVSAIAGQSRGAVTFAGEAGHAGNTPPRLRRDALAAAAELVLAVEAEMAAAPGLTATVGKIEVEPNVSNVIPGRALCTYDVRHQDVAVRDAAVEALREAATAIAARRGLDVDWTHLQSHDALPMSPRLRGVLVRACEAAGTPARELGSGAGHDPLSIAHLTPEVAMLFVRCRDGISHNPAESVREDDVAVAIEVVVEAIRILAAEHRA